MLKAQIASQLGKRVTNSPDDDHTSRLNERELTYQFHADQKIHESHSGTLSKLKIAVDYLCKPFKVAFRRKRNYSLSFPTHFEATHEVTGMSEAKSCDKDEESAQDCILSDEACINTLSLNPHASLYHSCVSSSVCENDASQLYTRIRSPNLRYCEQTSELEYLDINHGHEDHHSISLSQLALQHDEAESCSKLDASFECTSKAREYLEGRIRMHPNHDMEAKTDVKLIKDYMPRWYDFWPSDSTEQAGCSMMLQNKSDVHLSFSSSEIDQTTEDEESYLIFDEGPVTDDNGEEECDDRLSRKNHNDISSNVVSNVENCQRNNEEFECTSHEDGSMQTCNIKEDDIWSDEALISSQVKGFPPPISILANETHPGLPGHVPRTFWRSVKRGGRFVLQEVQACPREFFQATREHGRLRLQLVRPDLDPLGNHVDDSDHQSEEANPQIISDTKKLSCREDSSLSEDDLNQVSDKEMSSDHCLVGESSIKKHGKQRDENKVLSSSGNSQDRVIEKDDSSGNLLYIDEKKGSSMDQSDRGSSSNPSDLKKWTIEKDELPDQKFCPSKEVLETLSANENCPRYCGRILTMPSIVDDEQDSTLNNVADVNMEMGFCILAPEVEKGCINHEICESVHSEIVQDINERKEVFLHSEGSVESEGYGISLHKIVAPNNIGNPNNDNDQFKPDCCFGSAYGFENKVNLVLSPSQKFFQFPIQPVVR